MEAERMAGRVRIATEHDAAGCLEIYAPIVERSAISFELVPPSVREMSERIEKSLSHSVWIVLEDGGRIAGYAYATQFRTRPAYDWTAESTVYVDEKLRGRGAGRRLYGVLIGGLRLLGFRSVVAGITLPNAASVGLHEAVGFVRTGSVQDAGFKFDRWHQIGFWQLALGPGNAPERPRNCASLVDNPAWNSLLESGSAL